MEKRANDLSERLLNYAAGIIKCVTKLRRTAIGRELSGQLLRSGTSAGANYEEACGAQSRADFCA
jgi:four helix bundle protein